MHITQWGEYGIHCSLYLALRQREGVEAVSAAEIAESQGIALQYAQQILQRLRKGGIIESTRGPSGGYNLLKPAEQISVLDIIDASEGNTFHVICEDKPLSPSRCDSEVPCYLRDLWYGLQKHVNEYLGQHSLADLLERHIIEDKVVQLGLGTSSESA